jgi:hypothetical protein
MDAPPLLAVAATCLTFAAVHASCTLGTEGESSAASASVGAGASSTSSASSEAGGSSSTAAGAAGGGGGDATSASGGTGQGGDGARSAEANCYDGTDDDADGAADCADLGCQALGVGCIPKPPGNVNVFVNLLAPQSTCPAGATQIDVVACSGCTCTLDAAGTCQTTAYFHDSADCSDAAPVAVPIDENCQMNWTVENGSTSAAVVAEPASGACTAGGAAVAMPMVACTYPILDGGCDPAHSCAPGGACLALPDNASCPVGFANATLISDAAAATCDACNRCEVGEQACPAPAYQVYDDNNACSGTSTEVQGGGCAALGVTSKVSIKQESSPDATSATCHGFASPLAGNVTKVCCP